MRRRKTERKGDREIGGQRERETERKGEREGEGKRVHSDNDGEDR